MFSQQNKNRVALPSEGVAAEETDKRTPVSAGGFLIRYVSDLSLPGFTVTDSRGFAPHSVRFTPSLNERERISDLIFNCRERRSLRF